MEKAANMSFQSDALQASLFRRTKAEQKRQQNDEVHGEFPS